MSDGSGTIIERQALLDRLKELIRKTLVHSDQSLAAIGETTTLMEIGVASLDAVLLIFNIEDELGIQIDTSDLKATGNTTVSDILNMIIRLQSAQKASANAGQ